MSQNLFSVQSSSIFEPLMRTKIEFLSDPNNAARCILRVTYEDGAVFETHFNKNGGQSSQYFYDAKGNVIPAEAYSDQVPQADPRIALDPSDVRNPAARAANDVVNTASSVAAPQSNPPTQDHNEALAASGLNKSALNDKPQEATPEEDEDFTHPNQAEGEAIFDEGLGFKTNAMLSKNDKKK